MQEAGIGMDILTGKLPDLAKAFEQTEKSINSTTGSLAALKAAIPGRGDPGWEAAVLAMHVARREEAERRGVTTREVAGQPALQHGGIVTRPTMGLLGEAGPEAVVPLDKFGGNITINFTEPVFMEREESINKLADRIYMKIKQEQRLSFGKAYSG